MKDICYLVVTRSGVTRMTKRPPDLQRSEVAVKLSLTVPDTVFRSPFISADVAVTEQHVIVPKIEVAVIDERPVSSDG